MSGGNETRIGLVSCSKPKLDYPALARDLYQSDLFKAAREYAEMVYDHWFILSARYGLVHPDAVIEPYDLDLRKLPKAQRMAWGRDARTALRAEVYGMIGTAHEVQRAHVAIYLHAGEVYRDALDLESWRWEVQVPLEGLQIGQQLAWYAEWRHNRAKAA